MKPRVAPNAMNKNESIETEARLNARLVVEAAADRPEFSQVLHDRIMQSVREAPPRAVRGPVRRRLAPRLWMVGSATVAAVAILLAAWLARGVDPDSTAARPGPSIPPDPVTDLPDADDTPLAVVAAPAADRFAALVDATVSGSQWAFLDHDAQLAAGMVLNHIPFSTPQTDTP